MIISCSNGLVPLLTSCIPYLKFNTFVIPTMYNEVGVVVVMLIIELNNGHCYKLVIIIIITTDRVTLPLVGRL